MTANKQFPFMNKGTVTSSIDDLSSGVYGFHREVYDIKVEGFAYGELVVLNTGNSVANGGEPNMQIITNMDGETATRIKWNGVWGNWRRTDNFGYNTLNSLASGVAESMKSKKIFPFMLRGDIKDANNMEDGYGAYSSPSGSVNGPSRMSVGLIFQMSAVGLANGGSPKFQWASYWSGTGFGFFARAYWSTNGWTNWFTFSIN